MGTIVQTVKAEGAASATTIVAPTITVTAGNYLRASITYTNNLGLGDSIADDVNGAWGAALGYAFDSGNNVRRGVYVFGPCAGGATTVTCTLTNSNPGRAIVLSEISGTTGLDTGATNGGHAENFQATPGTGADGVTSGSALTATGTGLAIADSADTGAGVAAPAAGTGYSSVDTFGATTFPGRIESKTYTGAASVQALFTAGNNVGHCTLLTLFKDVVTSPNITPSAGALTLAGTAGTADRGVAAYSGAGLTVGSSSSFVGDGYVGAPDAQTSPALTPSAGVLTLASAAPAVTTPIVLAPTAGALAVSGVAPTVQQSAATLQPAVGSLALSGVAPSLTLTLPPPGVGALTLAGVAPTVTIGAPAITITPSAGALTLAGLATTVTRQTTIAPAVGALALAGVAPQIGGAVAIQPNVGALALAGAAPGVQLALNIQPSAGSLALTGAAAALTRQDQATPAAGALTIGGLQPAVTQQLARVASVGLLSLSGAAPTVQTSAAGTIQPLPGSLALTGLAPTVTQTTNAAAQPAVGTLTITGIAPTVSTTAGQQRQPSAAVLAITGAAPTLALTTNASIRPGAGLLSLTGLAAQVIASGVVVQHLAPISVNPRRLGATPGARATVHTQAARPGVITPRAGN